MEQNVLQAKNSIPKRSSEFFLSDHIQDMLEGTNSNNFFKINSYSFSSFYSYSVALLYFPPEK